MMTTDDDAHHVGRSAVIGRGDDDCDTDDPSDCIKGPLRPGDLEPHEWNCLKLKGVSNSIAQKRTGKALQY